MTNIKKQITRVKISEFLKENLLVLFFHYNSKSIHKWHAIKERMSITAFFAGSTLPLKNSPGGLDLQEEKQGSWSARSSQKVSSLLVKNKIALRVLDLHNVTRKDKSIPSLHLGDNLSHIKILDSSMAGNYVFPEKGGKSKDEKSKNKVIYKKNANFLQDKNNNNKQVSEKALPIAKEKTTNPSLSLERGSQNLEPYRDKGSLNSSLLSSINKSIEQVTTRQFSALFQGPALLLGLKKINSLENVLNVYKQEKDLILFGGIYYNKILYNQADIKRMGQLIKKDCNATDIVKEIQKGTQCALITLNKSLYSFFYLRNPKFNLLRTLQLRNEQLSKKFS